MHTQIHDYTNININKYTYTYIFLILNQRKNLGAHLTSMVITTRDARAALFCFRAGQCRRKKIQVGVGRTREGSKISSTHIVELKQTCGEIFTILSVVGNNQGGSET